NAEPRRPPFEHARAVDPRSIIHAPNGRTCPAYCSTQGGLMASISMRSRAASVLLAFTALCASHLAADACREGITADGPAAADPWHTEWTGGEQAAGGCPTPSCSAHGCVTVNPSTPFQRLPGYESSPISPYADCFSIAKRDANFYVQLSTKGPGGGVGFHRHVSTD